jgi:DNA-binding MarR family transcriptional regulator
MQADLDATLAEDLHIVAGALSRRLREQGGRGDVNSVQKSVLLMLERDGPATVSALARTQAMRPQSMGAIISALKAAGHVSGAPGPLDRRQTIVSLTDQFHEWVLARRAAKRDWLARALQFRLTAQERHRLAHAAQLLKRLLDDQQ